MAKNINIKELIILIFSIVIFIFAIFNFNIVINIFSYIIAILFPLFLGLLIAFILNIPMKFVEKQLNKKSKKRKKLKRILSILLSFILIIAIISLLLLIVIPEIYALIKTLIANIPFYEAKINEIINGLKEQFPNINLTTPKNADKTINDIILEMPSIVSFSLQIAKSAIGAVATLFLALILAFNILMHKEMLKKEFNQICNTYLKKETANKVIHITKLFIKKFENFITPVYIEAIIFGIICYIGMKIMQIPYAGEISCLVGFTALIPVIGVYIGMIIGTLLIVQASPLMAIVFIIFIFILKEIDSNIIYPKFVGDAVGLPSIWVIVSVMIGGSMFGLLGMLLAVPIGSIIYTLIKEDIKKKSK